MKMMVEIISKNWCLKIHKILASEKLNLSPLGVQQTAKKNSRAEKQLLQPSYKKWKEIKENKKIMSKFTVTSVINFLVPVYYL